MIEIILGWYLSIKWRAGVMVILLVALAGCLCLRWQVRAVHHQGSMRHTRQRVNGTLRNDGSTPLTFSSVKGRPIEALVFGHGRRTVLVLGGMHGDEPASVELARALVRQLQALPNTAIPQRVVVMPVVNPDGLAAHTRRNAHHIDLNRNFPTRDFGTGAPSGRYDGGRIAASEPETQAIMQVTERYQPALIMSFHAPLGCINYDGPAAEMALRIAQRDHFPVVAQFHQRFPGSLGTYYGQERGVPVITLELIPGQRQWVRHGSAILDAIGLTTHKE